MTVSVIRLGLNNIGGSTIFSTLPFCNNSVLRCTVTLHVPFCNAVTYHFVTYCLFSDVPFYVMYRYVMYHFVTHYSVRRGGGGGRGGVTVRLLLWFLHLLFWWQNQVFAQGKICCLYCTGCVKPTAPMGRSCPPQLRQPVPWEVSILGLPGKGDRTGAKY
jgi:hypothetical protein